MCGHFAITLTLKDTEQEFGLKYQNKRADYITAWWNVVDWDKVNEIFEEAQ